MAWFVGGAVRDLLLGRPLHDVDCCTDADPDAVQALFPQALTVGKAFGVMVVPHRSGGQTEIASFRSDEAYVDGRRPSGISPASEAEDVHRRDFTVNALLLDPETGLVRDHVGALADLDARILRCIGSPADRLGDDRLRVLRGWRFAAHYELEIEADTHAALCATGLEGVSRERLLQEWCRGLGSEYGWAWWRLIAGSPQREALCPAGSQVDEAAWTRGVAADPVLGSVLCLRDVDETAFAGWLGSLPWSRQQRKRLAWLHRALARRHDGDRLQRLRDQHDEEARGLAVLIAALQAVGESGLEAWQEDWAHERERPLPPFCSGRELIAAGLPAGPMVGEALRALEDAWLLGRIRGVQDVAGFVRSWTEQGRGPTNPPGDSNRAN